jgi:hypothetical protein
MTWVPLAPPNKLPNATIICDSNCVFSIPTFVKIDRFSTNYTIAVKIDSFSTKLYMVEGPNNVNYRCL